MPHPAVSDAAPPNNSSIPNANAKQSGDTVPTNAGVPQQLPVNALQAAIVGGGPFPQGNTAQPRQQYHTPPGITYGANPFHHPYPPMNHAFTNAALRPQIAIGNIPIAHPLGGRVSFHHGVGGNINLQQEFVRVPNPNPNPNPPLPYPNMPSIPPLNVNPPAQNSLPRPPRYQILLQFH